MGDIRNHMEKRKKQRKRVEKQRICVENQNQNQKQKQRKKARVKRNIIKSENPTRIKNDNFTLSNQLQLNIILLN